MTNIIEDWAQSGDVEQPSQEKINSGFVYGDAIPAHFNWIVREIIKLAKTAGLPDLIAPNPPSAIGVYNQDGTFGVYGTGEPGTTVTVTFPDTSRKLGFIDSEGNWGTVTSRHPQNTGNVTVVSTDSSGNESDPTVITIYNAGNPTIPTISYVNEVDGKLNVGGTGEPGSNINVQYPDSTTKTELIPPTGIWGPIESDAVQTSGELRAYITTDTFTTAYVKYIYADSYPPAPPTVVSNTNQITHAVTLNGTAEPSSLILITWTDSTQSSAVTAPNGTWGPVVSADGIPAGNILVEAVDLNGNHSDVVIVVAADTTAPGLVSNLVVTSLQNGTANITGNSEPGSTVEVEWTKGANTSTVTDGAGNFSITSERVQRISGAFDITATDQAGNSSGSVVVTYLDTVAPLAATVIGSVLTGGIFNVLGTAEPESTVVATFPDASTVSATTSIAGDWGPVQSATAQASGNVVIAVTDLNGNQGPNSTILISDVTVPDAPTMTGNQYPDGRFSVVGTGEPGATLTVTFPDSTTKSVTVAPGGNWGTVTSLHTQSTGTVTANQTDPSGNVSPNTSITIQNTIITATVTGISIAIVNGYSISPTVTSDETNVSIVLKWPPGTTPPTTQFDISGSSATFGPRTLLPGDNEVFEAWIVDGDGNESAHVTQTFTINPGAINQLTITGPLDGAAVVKGDFNGKVSSFSPVVSGRVASHVTWEVKPSGSPAVYIDNYDISGFTTAMLNVVGSYELRARWHDTVGGYGAWSDMVSFTVVEAAYTNIINELQSPTPQAYHHFGSSVAYDGHFMAIGSVQASFSGTNSGVTCMERSGPNFVTLGTLNLGGAGTQTLGSKTGYCVDIKGSILAVGSPTTNSANGQVDIYDVDLNGGVLPTLNSAVNGAAIDGNMGRSCLVINDLLVLAGAPFADTYGTIDSGRVDVLSRANASSSFATGTPLLDPDPNTPAGTYFGRALNESNGFIFIASNRTNGGSNFGRVLMYSVSGTTFTLEYTFTPPVDTISPGYQFGYGDGIYMPNNHTVYITNPYHDEPGAGSIGAVYEYGKLGNNQWLHTSTILGDAAGDFFGHDLAIVDETMVVGSAKGMKQYSFNFGSPVEVASVTWPDNAVIVPRFSAPDGYSEIAVSLSRATGPATETGKVLVYSE